MQKVPKDIDLIIYRFIHRDLMKQLNSEYKRTIKVCDCSSCNCNNVCSNWIIVSFLGQDLMYNYRYICVNRDKFVFIHDICNFSCGELPKNY